MTPIQTNIAGYSGKPCSLFSVYEADTRILSVIKSTDYKKSRQKDGYVLIGNDKSIDCDSLFVETDFSNAIDAFFSMLNGVAYDGSSSRLAFDSDVSRANPQTSIELDGYTESGQKFRISEGISNLQMAVLATCFYANNKCGAIESALTSLEILNDPDLFSQFMAGGILTV